MAMTMTGEVQLPASREVVWAKLNDTENAQDPLSCPAAKELNKNSDTKFGGCRDQNGAGEGAL